MCLLHNVCSFAKQIHLYSVYFNSLGPPDGRYIRAETCIFLLKLPQYSTLEIMSEKLRYAIHCMEDPLSG